MDMYIHRKLQEIIKKDLFKQKVLIIYGPRQAGKTTLVKHIVAEYTDGVRYIDCELLSNNELLTRRSAEELFSLVRGYKMVVFDEAQTVKGIGSVLKTLFDHHPEIQYIATGSSSFDLANEVSEPLTGRSREYILYPLGLTELVDRPFDAEQAVGTMMRFGGYPGLLEENEDEKKKDLHALVTQYLYKNVFSIGGVRKPELMTSLLKLLAFQIGNEVSYRELSQTLGTSMATVQKYIDLLEKNYVVMRLGSFSRNARNEVVRSKKIYFLDLGLRNALIDNFSSIESTTRPDIGALFENCMIVERLKHLVNSGTVLPNQFFWRTVDQKEIDYVEEAEGTLAAYEFKWSGGAKPPQAFLRAYPHSSFSVITKKEAYAFLTVGTLK